MLNTIAQNVRNTLVFLLISNSVILFSQKTYTISGYVEDGESSEKLIAATIFDEFSKKGVVTNSYGFYSLTLPSGDIKLTISYVGFESVSKSFYLSRDTTLHLSLSQGTSLQEIEIVENRVDKAQNRVQMSQVDVPIAQIKKAPALLGETDVLKVLQLLPGVKAGGEGQNGLYIRGGSPDQNLILLDGVPVYNVSHLGGFFSVFNGDAIRNVTLTKGGFPARYGGRLSSVIEIDMKEGNMKEFHGEGGIGLISSRLTLEGPIWKDKISFLVSGRRSYLDLLAAPLLKKAIKRDNGQRNTETKVGFDAHFYDLNAKINFKINDRHRLYLSAYNGLDIFGLTLKHQSIINQNYERTKGGFDWGNLTAAFRWNWLMNKKLFANTTVTYSNYQVNVGVEQGSQKDTVVNNIIGKYISGIKDVAVKFDLDYIISPTYRIRTGLGEIYHTYTPGAFQYSIKAEDFKKDTLLGSAPSNAHEMYTYIENEWQWGKIKANVGLHSSAFITQNNNYSSIQPRIGINASISPTMSLKGSFVTMRQYINLLTNERIGLPTDLWVPTTARIKPQEAWQAAIGMSKELKNNIEFSAEVYFKNMKNLVSYTDGANLLSLNSSWENQVTQGDGKSYGAELFLQKKTGKTTGWIGYTLSWNNRTFADLNRGLTYPFKYDNRHDFTLLISHTFTKRFSMSGSWQYRTGNAVTLPIASYQAPSFYSDYNNPNNATNWLNNYVSIYDLNETKNQYRMAAYHRMDLNFEWKKQKKHHERSWVLGAYNLYNRANPFYLSIGSKGEYVNGIWESRRAVQQTSIFPIIPYFSYNFKF